MIDIIFWLVTKLPVQVRPERKESKNDLDFPARIEKNCGRPKVLGLSPGSGNFLYFRSARHDP
jgi:hypothetical protein